MRQVDENHYMFDIETTTLSVKLIDNKWEICDMSQFEIIFVAKTFYACRKFIETL
jgi:hypothetical protein